MRQTKVLRERRGALAAARTYLRVKLGWLHGLPAAKASDGTLTWTVLPRAGRGDVPEQIRIDRELLRRTEYGRNALRRRFPRALPKIVGDVDAWTIRTDQQLEILKAIIHDGADFPDLDALLTLYGPRRQIRQRITHLAQRSPTLAVFATRLLWLHWHDEDRLARILPVLDANQHALARLTERLDGSDAIVTGLLCLYLFEDRVMGRYLDLIADERSWRVPLSQGDFRRSLNKQIKAASTKQTVNAAFLAGGVVRPHAKLGEDLVAYLNELWASDGQTRARSVRLLDLFAPWDVLDQWDRWWHEAHALEREVRRVIGSLPGAAQAELERLSHEVTSLTKAPDAWQWQDIKALIERLTHAARADEFEALVTCASGFTTSHGRKPVRQTFLETWAHALKRPASGRGAVPELIAGQERVLSALPEERSQHQVWIADDLAMDAIDTWLDDAEPQRWIAPCFHALAHVVARAAAWDTYNGPFRDYTGWDCLVATVKQVGDPDVAATLLLTVPPNIDHISGEAWTVLLRLSDGEPKHFEQLAKQWRPEHWSQEGIKELLKLIDAPAAAYLVTQMLVHGDGKRASRVVALARGCRSLKLPIVPPSPKEHNAESDLSAYPEELHGALAELALWERDFESAADHILSKDFPLRRKLEAERAVLVEMIGAADPERTTTLQLRLNSLDRRLTTKATASPQRLQNYQIKIERRTRHARLLAWEDMLTNAFQGALADKIGTAIPDDVIANTDTLYLFGAVAALDGVSANLAYRLIRTRCGLRPWDLRDDPANAGFLAELTRRGVDVSVWMDGIGSRDIEVDSQTWTIDLETDPLEILRMGAPFDTCLAPGSFNFFSAVSNAADINKQVVYVRDRERVIRGRCLICLTDEGNIIAFYVYAHQRNDRLKEAIHQYIHDLKSAMGNQIVARGVIRKLVARDWYDDGPDDITGQLQFLSLDSPFMCALTTMSPDALPRALEDELDVKLITPSVVVAVAQTDAVRERPELILSLRHYLGDLGALDAFTCADLVSVFRRAGDTDTALQMLTSLIAFVARRRFEYQWLNVIVAREATAQGFPDKALRIIRDSRSREARRRPDDWGERVVATAEALLALNRDHQALDMFYSADSLYGVDVKKQIADLKARLSR